MAEKRHQAKATLRKPGQSVARADSAATKAKARLHRAARTRDQERYVLRLYVTGMTRTSAQALERVRAICEQHLHGRYELEVIDIYQLPALARDQQIVATPTLIKVLPLPIRRFIGNLSNVENLLFGLDLRKKE